MPKSSFLQFITRLSKENCSVSISEQTVLREEERSLNSVLSVLNIAHMNGALSSPDWPDLCDITQRLIHLISAGTQPNPMGSPTLEAQGENDK